MVWTQALRIELSQKVCKPFPQNFRKLSVKVRILRRFGNKLSIAKQGFRKSLNILVYVSRFETPIMIENEDRAFGIEHNRIATPIRSYRQTRIKMFWKSSFRNPIKRTLTEAEARRSFGRQSGSRQKMLCFIWHL
ncbi:hypothetical protein ATE67_00320 [Sphingopyxis sp. H050]|nr:hypothetical protein ATE67_00320 [Sphingopyxis sp. H050]